MSNLPKYKNNLKALIDSLIDQDSINAVIALQKDLQKKVDFFNQSIKQYEDAIRYANKVVEIQENIVEKTINSIPDLSFDKKNIYSPDWKYPKKVIYVLFEKERFLKFKEISEIIVSKDGKGDVRGIARQLTYSTKTLKQDKTIIGISPTGKDIDTFWGFPEWIDDSGNIKPDNIFDFKAVKMINELVSPYKEMYENKKEPEGSNR